MRINLPVHLTSFVGRQSALVQVCERLADARLVTLTGSGGCGKTRLALEAVHRMGDEYPDGVWWVDLAPLADPSMVPAALAELLDVHESPLETITDGVQQHLHRARALVVLDNCEHLIRACSTLAMHLVRGCPGVTVLATSREVLGVAGEMTWPVPPLTREESLRLFVDRTRLARPNRALDDDERAIAAEVCDRLDGIPLAIELAAARTRLLSVNQIADGLADRFHLLTGGHRATLPRHRTLEGSVDWSHDLLDEEERAAFRRLAVFAASFTLPAAEAVCAADDIEPSRVLDLVGSLVDRSLVQVANTAGPETRYRLLETIRAYALGRLTTAGELAATRNRHLDFYVSFSGKAAAGLKGPDLVQWLARIDAETPNVRTALEWAPKSANAARGLCLVRDLNVYWFVRSDVGVGRARLRATVDRARGPTIARAGALVTLCWSAYRAGEMSAAAAYGDEAIQIARQLGDTRTLGAALSHRAAVRFWGEADPETAWTEFAEADGLLRDGSDRGARAMNLGWLSQSLSDSRRASEVGSLAAEGVALTRDANTYARCPCLFPLALAEMLDGGFDRGAALLEEALALAREIGDHYSEVVARFSSAQLSVLRGDYADARAHADRGLSTALDHRTPNGEAFMRQVLGDLELAEGNVEVAADELGVAFEIYQQVMPRQAPWCRAVQANAALAQGRTHEAHRFAAEALALGREARSVLAPTQALVTQAILSVAGGDARHAEDLLHDALDIVHDVGLPVVVFGLLQALAGATVVEGRFEEAGRLLGAAQHLGEAAGLTAPSVARPMVAMTADAARDALGPDAFDQAWAEGSAMSLEDVVAYARRGRAGRKRPSFGWESLTPMENQVVELVAAGLTNTEVGAKLFVSPRTVQTHLTHVYNKLGVANRTELATAYSNSAVEGARSLRH